MILILYSSNQLEFIFDVSIQKYDYFRYDARLWFKVHKENIPSPGVFKK
ncbi:MAG: hypothetical protein NTW82_12835 [Bacteroidia bacterium]|nr:hypothetical protein [Bacteroidia bacterium]